jgi:cell division protein FtsL
MLAAVAALAIIDIELVAEAEAGVLEMETLGEMEKMLLRTLALVALVVDSFISGAQIDS